MLNFLCFCVCACLHRRSDDGLSVRPQHRSEPADVSAQHSSGRVLHTHPGVSHLLHHTGGAEHLPDRRQPRYDNTFTHNSHNTRGRRRVFCVQSVGVQYIWLQHVTSERGSRDSYKYKAPSLPHIKSNLINFITQVGLSTQGICRQSTAHIYTYIEICSILQSV